MPDAEFERLILTPQSFVAVADSSSDTPWAVRVSGVCLQTSSQSCPQVVWTLELSSQQEMVIWHSTVRVSVVIAMNASL